MYIVMLSTSWSPNNISRCQPLWPITANKRSISVNERTNLLNNFTKKKGLKKNGKGDYDGMLYTIIHASSISPTNKNLVSYLSLTSSRTNCMNIIKTTSFHSVRQR